MSQPMSQPTAAKAPHPRSGQPYRPSNGTDGDCFTAQFCDRCSRGFASHGRCSILAAALFLEIREPGYPPEWVYGDDGPTCTAFAEVVPREPGPRRIKPAKGQADLFGTIDEKGAAHAAD